MVWFSSMVGINSKAREELSVSEAPRIETLSSKIGPSPEEDQGGDGELNRTSLELGFLSDMSAKSKKGESLEFQFKD
jgi:hypothetical protein